MNLTAEQREAIGNAIIMIENPSDLGYKEEGQVLTVLRTMLEEAE